MKINWITIKGFRNFDDETIHFADKTLIIGANDVGKTNLLYALRLLFDKSLSDRDLELSESDYNAYTKTKKIEITIELDDIKEDCLKSTFVDAIKDNKLYIRYSNSFNGNYSIHIGCSLDLLEEKSRFYTKRLNMEFVNTNRDLFSFLRREKNKLLELSKERLSEEDTTSDKQSITTIQTNLNTINQSINSLKYINSSLETVNSKLRELSVHNEDQNVRFVAGNSDAQKLLDNLELSYTSEDSLLSLGGDGRNNQIFLATWIAKQEIEKSPDHITFYAIEEPEAHLHPHQQRKLSNYIIDYFNEQIFLTTHSPQIASGFTPDKIIRLYTQNKISYAAQGGCSNQLKITFDDFGYRLNAISSEAFFSDGIYLVEGPSEKLFYTALAQNLDIDLDNLNISILSVDGIGFKPYIKICQSLNIPFVMRTDNDIFLKTKDKIEYNYFAGISRAMQIYIEFICNSREDYDDDDFIMYWNSNKENNNEWLKSIDIPDEAMQFNAQIKNELEKFSIFLADCDLESDLVNSCLYQKISNYYNITEKSTLINEMQKRKAENMLGFLQQHSTDLNDLSGDKISIPLLKLKSLVEEGVHPDA